MPQPELRIPDCRITPPIDRKADALADAIQEMAEGVSELRRHLAARKLDAAQWAAGDIQNGYWGLDHRPEAADALCWLARLVYEALRGRTTLKAELASSLRPIVDAMEEEVALLEES